MKFYRRFIFLIGFLFLFSCEKVEKKRIIKKKYNVNLYYNDCIQEKVKKDIVVLFFEGNYNEDLIEVFCDGEKIFDGFVTTDPKLGLAKDVEIGKLSSVNEVSFRINKGNDVVIKEINCNFLTVNYIGDSLVLVNFKNKFFGYY